MDLIGICIIFFLSGQIDVGDEGKASFKKKPNTLIT